MVPIVLFPPRIEFTYHPADGAIPDPFTTALNVCVAPMEINAGFGVTASFGTGVPVGVGVGVGVGVVPPPAPPPPPTKPPPPCGVSAKLPHPVDVSRKTPSSVEKNNVRMMRPSENISTSCDRGTITFK